MLIRGEDSAINLPSTLTEEEKWHYDLFGYLVLRQVISPAEVERMLEIANRWFADPETAPEPVNVTQDEHSGGPEQRSVRRPDFRAVIPQ